MTFIVIVNYCLDFSKEFWFHLELLDWFAQRLVKDIYKILDQVNSEQIPENLKVPHSFKELLSEMKRNKFDAKTFAISLKAMVCDCFFFFNLD